MPTYDKNYLVTIKTYPVVSDADFFYPLILLIQAHCQEAAATKALEITCLNTPVYSTKHNSLQCTDHTGALSVVESVVEVHQKEANQFNFLTRLVPYHHEVNAPLRNTPVKECEYNDYILSNSHRLDGKSVSGHQVCGMQWVGIETKKIEASCKYTKVDNTIEKLFWIYK